jgi:L-iditol 2-dehydrogenase
VHAVGITQIRPYDSVLVIGAGTIGLLTMQVLLLSGARQVVVSDVSDARLEVARRMGAVDVVNPSKTDFDAYVRSFTAGHGFDITFEAVGITPTVAQSVTAVKDGGKIVWIGNNQRTVEVDMQAIVTRELSVLGTYGMNDRDFGRALQMLADGKIDVASLVTRRAALSEGPTLFDELLHDPETIKCVIQMA